MKHAGSPAAPLLRSVAEANPPPQVQGPAVPASQRSSAGCTRSGRRCRERARASAASVKGRVELAATLPQGGPTDTLFVLHAQPGSANALGC